MANLYDLTATPQYWGGMLPRPDEFDTWQAYRDALQAAFDAQNVPAYAAATIDPETGWRTAGLSPQSPNYGKTEGQLAADQLSRAYMDRFQQGARKGSPLAFQSRVAMHPEEARAAYNSFTISPEGLPEASLPPFILAALEALGYISGNRGAKVQPGVPPLGGGPATPPGGVTPAVDAQPDPTRPPGGVVPGVDPQPDLSGWGNLMNTAISPELASWYAQTTGGAGQPLSGGTMPYDPNRVQAMPASGEEGYPPDLLDEIARLKAGKRRF